MRTQAPFGGFAEPTLQLVADGDCDGKSTMGAAEWLPHVDLCEGLGAFTVLVDLPALSATDLAISRQGAKTIVRGGRKPPYPQARVLEEVRTERRFGRFVLTVRVPDTYEKRWQQGKLADGVLRLSYAVDEDE